MDSVFSPDGRTLYHSDSRRSSVCFVIRCLRTVASVKKRLFVRAEKGVPDGLVVSVDGRVWVALAGEGHGVAVFSADGKASGFVEIPQSMCTSVCFGGDDLKDLYIVSGLRRDWIGSRRGDLSSP